MNCETALPIQGTYLPTRIHRRYSQASSYSLLCPFHSSRVWNHCNLQVPRYRAGVSICMRR